MCKSYQPEDPGLSRVSDLFSQEIMDGALAGQVAYEGKMIIRQKGSILVGALATVVLDTSPSWLSSYGLHQWRYGNYSIFLELFVKSNRTYEQYSCLFIHKTLLYFFHHLVEKAVRVRV